MKVKKNNFVKLSVLLIFLSITVTGVANEKENISFFMTSKSYSNILPVKPLIKDNWQSTPSNSASHAFTQNEIGVRSYWQNFSFTVSKRYDHFLYTNKDTAHVFYLDKKGLPLNTQNNYQLDLAIQHQRSNGVRLGYKFNEANVTSEIRLGYWQSKASRESKLSGELLSDNQGSINGKALLSEYYSDKNFLRRTNNNDWNTEGEGVTLDVFFNWQTTQEINITAQLSDLYSNFSLNNSGYSTGQIDTDGTFVNSVGGIAYLPLYRGREVSKKHNFTLPKQVDVLTTYATEHVNYLGRYKKQGDVDFYYLGVELLGENSATKFFIDIENLTPEIDYQHKWFRILFAMDDANIDKAMLINLAVSVNYQF